MKHSGAVAPSQAFDRDRANPNVKPSKRDRGPDWIGGGRVSLIEKATLLTDMARNARNSGDAAASLELAIESAKLLQLARLLGVCVWLQLPHEFWGVAIIMSSLCRRFVLMVGQ
jgi:hypothetical protein